VAGRPKASKKQGLLKSPQKGLIMFKKIRGIMVKLSVIKKYIYIYIYIYIREASIMVNVQLKLNNVTLNENQERHSCC